MRRAATLVVAGLILGVWTSPSLAQTAPMAGASELATATLVTESTLPVTEIEVGFSFRKSDASRTYDVGLTSVQYAWGTLLGLKMSVPFTIIEPRDDADPTVAGVGDVSILAKSAPIVSREHLFALGGAVSLTLPTGSESRGLGGMWALAPGLLAGKAWRVGDRLAALQADAFYSWQLDEPAESDREQRFSANLTSVLTLTPRLTAIVELNSVRVVEGDPDLRGRWQGYVTPGLSVQPADRWDIRGGVQVPLTGAREFDYNVIMLVTRSF
jgi:Putative MetA-pathway of phenol degradation